MRRIHSQAAAVLTGLVMLSGVSVATAGSASAGTTVPALRAHKVYKAIGACQTKGNKLAQKGKLTTFRCKHVVGGYILIITK